MRSVGARGRTDDVNMVKNRKHGGNVTDVTSSKDMFVGYGGMRNDGALKIKAALDAYNFTADALVPVNTYVYVCIRVCICVCICVCMCMYVCL